MKGSILFWVLVFGCWVAGFGQARPDLFTIEANPTDANFEVYSQKNGINRRASLSAIRRFCLAGVNAQTISFVPPATGNVTNLGQIVRDPNGNVHYIDGYGNAVVLEATRAPGNQFPRISATGFDFQVQACLDTSYSYVSVFITDSQDTTFHIDSLQVSFPGPITSISTSPGPSGITARYRLQLDVSKNNQPLSFTYTDKNRNTTVLQQMITVTKDSCVDSGVLDVNPVIVKRVPAPGDTIPANTVSEYIGWQTRVEPNVSIDITNNAQRVFEYGTSTNLGVFTAITNPSDYTLSNAVVGTIGGTQVQFTGTAYARNFSFAPVENGSSEYTASSYTFRSQVNYVFQAEAGTALSNTIMVQGVYPVFWGMSATDFHTTGNISTSLNKLIVTEGNHSVALTGTNMYMYYAVPVTWGDVNLSSIKDPNGFETLPSWSTANVTVVSPYWTKEYKIYKLNNLTNASSALYTFTR